MRLLRAKKHITCQHSPLNHIAPEVKLVSVNDLMLTANLNWMKKRYPNFKDSIEGAGMIYPIIYTDLEHYWLKEKIEEYRTERECTRLAGCRVLEDGTVEW